MKNTAGTFILFLFGLLCGLNTATAGILPIDIIAGQAEPRKAYLKNSDTNAFAYIQEPEFGIPVVKDNTSQQAKITLWVLLDAGKAAIKSRKLLPSRYSLIYPVTLFGSTDIIFPFHYFW